jgi:hypothetical protein
MHKIVILKSSSSPNLVISVAFAAGMLASLTINNVSRLLDAWEGLGIYVVALVVFVFIGWLIEYTAPINTKFKGIIKYLGIFCFAIAPGVFVDVIMDFYLRHYDRNLFPFEILMWWVFAPLPLLTGIMLARIFFTFKEKNGNRSNPT